MALYRVYVDEVGNHDMSHVDDPRYQFLSLTGVILETGHYAKVVQREMEDIKREFFLQDPDEPVIFHRKEVVNRRPPFQALRNPQTEQEFNTVLLSALARWDYHVVTVVLDKKAHRDRYRVWRYHPYHYCLAVLLERYILFLADVDGRGDVLVESRGGKEDGKLKESYRRLYERGTDFIGPERWQTRLTSRELKVKPRRDNIAGLQLADLIAHASQREILLDHRLVEDDRETFGARICEILREGKYLRSGTGEMDGYGRKLLP